MKKFRVMFICTGNICRSPLAHAVFENIVKEKDLDGQIEVDSSGTGAWHVGEQADSRMRKTARRHGVHLNHRSQQLISDNLRDFDLLLTMDADNYRDVCSLCSSDEELKKIKMFRDFDPVGDGDVPDPWYGGIDGFETVWDIVYRTSHSLLDSIHQESVS